MWEVSTISHVVYSMQYLALILLVSELHTFRGHQPSEPDFIMVRTVSIIGRPP